MEDLRFGTAIRTARIRRNWRQKDLSERAGVSRATIWRAERGLFGEMRVTLIRRICEPLEIRLELQPRGRGADLDRMINARHSALHESVARAIATDFPEWQMAHEVSFSIWGERGIIDILLWHPGRRALLIIELKTEIVDTGDLLGTMDRRRRLAREIVKERGWDPLAVSAWIVVAGSRTNERRVAESRAVLRSAYPDGGQAVRRWLRDPAGSIAALSMWPVEAVEGRELAARKRVRRVVARP